MMSPNKTQPSVRFAETAQMVLTEKLSKEELAFLWYSEQEHHHLKHVLINDMNELWQNRAVRLLVVSDEDQYKHIGIEASFQAFRFQGEHRARHMRAVVAAQASQRWMHGYDAIELSQVSQRSSECSRAKARTVAALSSRVP